MAVTGVVGQLVVTISTLVGTVVLLSALRFFIVTVLTSNAAKSAVDLASAFVPSTYRTESLTPV